MDFLKNKLNGKWKFSFYSRISNIVIHDKRELNSLSVIEETLSCLERFSKEEWGSSHIFLKAQFKNKQKGLSFVTSLYYEMEDMICFISEFMMSNRNKKIYLVPLRYFKVIVVSSRDKFKYFILETCHLKLGRCKRQWLDENRIYFATACVGVK